MLTRHATACTFFQVFTLKRCLSMREVKMGVYKVVLSVLLSITAMTQVGLSDNLFYGFSHVFAPDADTYLVDQQNVRKYGEWQSPSITYWGPSANGVLGSLTYRFDFDNPSKSIALKAHIESFNFIWGNAHGWYGSGTGLSSLWASTDGTTWELLLDNPTPANSVGSSRTYDDDVPEFLLGSQSFWVQVRMRVDGAPNSSYTTAQFCRSTSANPDNVFQIDVTTVPEPSIFTLSLLGIGLVCFRLHRSSRESVGRS